MKYKKKGELRKTDNEEYFIAVGDATPVAAGHTPVIVWDLCDGNNTVDDIIDFLTKETKVERSEVEKIVLNVLEELEKENCIKQVA